MVGASPTLIAVCALILLPVFGCGAFRADPQPPVPVQGDPAAYTALFSAAVRTMFKWTAPGSTFRVDPRPLKANPETEYPNADELAVVDPEVIRQRSLALQRLGIAEADAVGERCVGQGGFTPPPPPLGRLTPPPVPNSAQAERARCRAKGYFETVIFGLPRPGGAHFPPRYVDERTKGLKQGYQTVRRISLDPSGWAVYDLVFAPAPDGHGWVLVEEKSLSGIVS